MSTANSDLSHTVAFGRSKADLALLKAIKKHLGEHSDSTFNELCKEALRHFLMATEPPAALTLLLDLQQQLTELRLQMEAVEETVANHQVQMRQQQDQSVADLAARLEQVERHLYPERFIEIQETPPVREPDPLLKRMAELLEDF
jgi:hypothetical protein